MTDVNFHQSGGFIQTGLGSTVQIHGGQFVQHNQAENTHKCYEATDGFQHLQAHVATSAFDSQDHVDAPKCHPSTRKVVLGEITNWILLAVTRIQWVLWLNGAAGAGKSAIGRSIIDLCIGRNIPIARFFFFRTDSTQNNIKPLVATLVHQLLHSIPELEPIIVPQIKLDPLIFTKSLKTQFEFLIFSPLCELARISSHLRTLVLLFDGVDECIDKDDQALLIRIVAEFVGSHSFPAIAFFTSRNEDQISTVFRSAALANITQQLPLDNNYHADDDIRLFLNESFNEIRHTHQFAQLLSTNWPAASDVEKIVEKASGQFIYASVVLKFCAMLGSHPERQFKIILGIQPHGMHTPFAQLDALYQHIFSQVQDYNVVSLILAWNILTTIIGEKTMGNCSKFCGLEISDVYIALSPLQSVLDYTSSDEIQFLHASLPDFLLDKNRSQEYHINSPTWSTCLSVMAHKFVMTDGDQSYIPVDMYLSEAEVTPELRDCVLAYNPEMTDYSQAGATSSDLAYYLSFVKNLDFGDGPGGSVYQQQLNACVHYCRKEAPNKIYHEYTVQGHDISNILQQIESESAPMEPNTPSFLQWDLDQPELFAEADEDPQQILAEGEDQQESAAPNLEMHKIKSNPVVPKHKIFRALGKFKSRETTVQETGTHHVAGETSSAGRVKFGLTRLFKR